MSLETPDKIRMLQRKLYRKAKAEPDYRFYLLYDKIYREDILPHAYDTGSSEQGRAGSGWEDDSQRSSRRAWKSGWPASGRSYARRRIDQSRCDG